MKKYLSFVLVLVLLFCLTSPALARNEQENDEEIKRVAYLDYDTASTAMKEKILEARNKIIFSSNWVADGCSGCIQDVESGETIKILPSFSELFPGWAIPTQSSNVFSSASLSGASSHTNSRDAWWGLGSISHYLQAATNVNATPLITFFVDPFQMGTTIRTYATYLTSSETYNIGYSNATTGASLGYATNLSLNQALVVYGVGDINLAIRASTYSTPGWSVLAIDGSNRLVPLK